MAARRFPAFIPTPRAVFTGCTEAAGDGRVEVPCLRTSPRAALYRPVRTPAVMAEPRGTGEPNPGTSPKVGPRSRLAGRSKPGRALAPGRGRNRPELPAPGTPRPSGERGRCAARRCSREGSRAARRAGAGSDRPSGPTAPTAAPPAPPFTPPDRGENSTRSSFPSARPTPERDIFVARSRDHLRCRWTRGSRYRVPPSVRLVARPAAATGPAPPVPSSRGSASSQRAMVGREYSSRSISRSRSSETR